MRKSISTFILITLISCSIYSQDSTKKDAEIKNNEQLFNAFKENLESGHFYFEADWATSNTGRRINLTTSPNFLKLNDLQANGHLPFYGVAHTTSFGQGGIQFDNQIQEYESSFSDEKKKATIKFNVKNKTEQFMVELTIFQNKSATVSISSNYRTTMNYQGKLKPIVQNEQ